MDLEIGRLRALLELARCGTMAAAAEALFLTPSAVSQQIAQLEEEVGIKLTERIGRGVRLTAAGHALVAHAERLMVVMDEARSEMAELRREIAGELRVAAFPSIASVVLPDTVKALRRAFPRMEIAIDELEAIDGVTALRSWRTDVALIDDLSLVAGDNREHVTTVPLAEDVWYVTVSTDHPLSKKPSLNLLDLKDEIWAIESRGGTIRQHGRRVMSPRRIRTAHQRQMSRIRDGRSDGGLRLLGIGRPRPSDAALTARRGLGQAEAGGSPQNLRRLSPRRAQPSDGQSVCR